MTLPRCPRCATTVEPDWDWCRQCGYDPDHLRPEGAAVAAAPATDDDGATRRARSKKRKATVPAAAPPPEPPPLPPPRPTETAYGMLPYDHPSSVAPVVPEDPDRSELVNRRFAIVALCVIAIGLALLVAMLLG